MVISVWGRSNTSQFASAPIRLKAGQTYDIGMDYVENSGGARAQLLWSSGSVAKQVIPGNQFYTYPHAGPSGTEQAPALNASLYQEPPANNVDVGSNLNMAARRPMPRRGFHPVVQRLVGAANR